MNKLLEKLKQFFNKLKGKKTPLLNQTDVEIENNKDDKKIQFKEKLNVEEKQKVFQIQRKYEKKEMSEDDITMLELIDLIELYKNQIDELDTRISLKKSKLNKV